MKRQSVKRKKNQWESSLKCLLIMYWTSWSMSFDSVFTAAINSAWCGFSLLVKYAVQMHTCHKLNESTITN